MPKVKVKINEAKNWGLVDKGRTIIFYTASGNTAGVDVRTVQSAINGTPMGPAIIDRTNEVEVLGACWDCCVAIRERMIFPANPWYKDILAVSDQLKAHLGNEVFETFLRPTPRVGLPPKQ